MYLLFVFGIIILTCFAKLPSIDQLVYIGSSEYVVITPKQITWTASSSKPKFQLNFYPNQIITGKFYQLSNIFSNYGIDFCYNLL